MYRLLQGDVGSGKTALALCACLAVVAGGAQALLLAPTAVLASQHAGFIRRCLEGSRVTVELLTGGAPATESARIRAAAADGSCRILIGTHALLEERVEVADCGLAVIDEQHKFGVHQRAALAGKGGARADLLLMTATPIPRTLALTAFGDLAVSRIDGRPPGRAAVATEVAVGSAARVLAEVSGHPGQALVVCPLRAAAEEGDAGHAAEEAAARLAAHLGAGCDLLHGAMPEERKLAAIARLLAGATRVLVSTTVVEVGIDVPTLDLLCVLDADRFGLAQLHQLRGRLGRGALPGRCLLLVADPAKQPRLGLLAASDDGLRVAEADLAERGPGELLGTRQHGQWRLRVADLARDLDLLQDAHAWAAAALARGEPMPAGLAGWLPPEGEASLAAG
jgi:ATP-dependent DNA helicase RecG